MATSLGLVLAACLSLAVADLKFIDLSHTFGKKTIYWPLNPPFNFSLAFRAEIVPGVVAEANYFQTAEHSGTHMDAPRHFCVAGKQVHDIALDKLSGPGVVLDFEKEADKNIDFKITIDHIKEWEKEHGQIPLGSIVLMKFGWNKYWPDWNKVFQTKNMDDFQSFHWPGLAPAASDWLAINRQIHALGTDAPSPDFAQTNDFAVHVKLLCDHGVIILENVGNIAALPVTGTRIFIGALKLEYGSGTPVRLFATMGSGAGSIQPQDLLLMCILSYLLLHRLW